MTVIINGTTGIDTVQDGIVTDGKLNLTANSQEIKDAINASGAAPIYACRAWVNFNGTGTVAIRASGNVSSITDNNTGDYRVNFTTSMPDLNYSTTCSTNSSTGDSSRPVVAVDHDNNPGNCTIRTVGTFNNNTNVDCSIVNVAIFR
jgi:hypothetical protein